MKSCSVEFNDDRDAAEVTCEVCDEHFQMPINYLHEAIDVYNEWIDQCDAANVKYINDW